MARESVAPVEVLAGNGALVLSCEHASERVPPGWRLGGADRRLAGTHWAFDLGAAELTREIAVAVGSAAVLSRFTRLLADPNRPESSDELFRRVAEGLPVELNAAVDEGERERRLGALYRPYHVAVDECVRRSAAAVVLAVHTFTPVYEGVQRAVEVGVLFDRDEAPARALLAELEATGLVARSNEPYSGRDGLIHSAELHARAHGRLAVEIELRQDLAVQPAQRARVAEAVRRWASRF